MKTLLITLLTVLTANFAQAVDSGLNCSMEYSVAGPLTTVSESTSRWLVAGDQMEGTAVIFDGDGDFVGSSAAHILSIGTTTVDGFEMWTVKVLNGEHTILGQMNFHKEAGMSTTLPVRAYANDSEDPTQYNALKVTCAYTIFAG